MITNKASLGTLIFIHGIYQNSLILSSLANRLKAKGYNALHFEYPSISHNLDENAEQFAHFIRYQKEHKGEFSIIAHSLGSIVSQKAIERYPDLPIQKIVAICPPFQGAKIAGLLQKFHLDFILGKANRTLTPKAQYQKNYWQSHKPLGVIAGNRRFGISALLLNNREPNDGTVYLHETIIPGMRDHIILPYTHNDILLAAETADQCHAFLAEQKFLRSSQAKYRILTD